MTTRFALAYRFGITPWDKSGAALTGQFQRLMEREEEGLSKPFGRVLDLGCGTGEYTRELQERGWDAVGVDNVRRAVDTAISHGSSDTLYVIGDVTSIQGCGVGTSFALFLDVGCFNSLGDAQRLPWGEGVTKLASPGATMLVLCTEPRGWPRKHGGDREALERALPGWHLVSEEPADVAGLPATLRHSSPTWFRLTLG
ncbi:methyltransferase domain-containing protein [Nocardioides sp. MAHUQ-72]|uniref:methyltransferase domain-containing protein n=1 Tax=unclassified Nocardioides TaxID=2615069 RepID=UPI00361AEA2D